MISKYIKELIKDDNNRIIVPDFGAFMVQNTAAGKQISFNDFLKFNDGLLINHIIKSEKIGKVEAGEKVKTFIKDVEKCFVDRKPFEIKEVGFLIKDDQNNIKFSVKPELITSKTEVKPTINKNVEPPKPKVEFTTIKTGAKTQQAGTKTVEQTNLGTTPKTNIPPQNNQITKNKKTVVAGKTTAKQEVKNKSNDLTVVKENKIRNIIFLIVGIILLLGILTFIDYKFSIVGLFDKQQTVEQQPNIVKPEPIIDSLQVSEDSLTQEELEPVEEVKEEQKQVVDINAKRYYLVAGSFRVKSNAVRFNQKLINEGYSSEIINRSSGFFTVSYKTFYSWNEALVEMKSMRASHDPQTWILVK